MANIVIVGMQWGDEGKGKIVDLLCPAFDVVVRYQGGHNAGHTVKFGDRHFALHLIPSGILHEGVDCYLGNGMVVHPEPLFEELEGLHAAGVRTEGRLWLSDRAHVLLPAHATLDQARESARGVQKIGTTSRGIGPAYEAKVSRFGLRACDLLADDLEERMRAQLHKIEAELESLGAPVDDLAEESVEWARRYGERLAPMLCDVSLSLDEARRAGRSILFEGAQGTLLDIDHGTYPFVTSSNSTAGGACTGAGVPPQAIAGAVGILKAYTTRVGGGPFPTELEDATGEHLRERGHEFGTTTGRPRRCGWLDLVVARYARRINGVESIAVTKLDVLDSLPEIEICVGYRYRGETLRELPADTGMLEAIEPVYETLPGWQQDTAGTLEVGDLPQRARDYLRFLEDGVEAEVGLVSTGPRREETLVTEAPWLRRQLGDAVDRVVEQLG